MKKLDLKIKNDEKLTEAYDLIYSNNEVKEIIKNLKMTDREIKENYELLLYMIEQNSPCINCKGINDCKKIQRGYKYSLFRDMYGIVNESFVQCDYYKDYYKLETNLLYSSINKDDIIFQKGNFIKDNIEKVAEQKAEPLIFYINDLKENKKDTLGYYFESDDSKFRKNIFASLLQRYLLINFKCVYLKMSSFIRQIKLLFKDSDNYSKLLNTVMNCDVLIIDGLGDETISAWSRDEILFNILSYRYDNELVSIFGSDYPLKQLKLVYTTKNDAIKAEKLEKKIKQFLNR